MPERILILQTAFLGDLILTLPLLDAVHRRWPKASIDVIVRASYANVLDGHAAVRSVIPYDKHASERGIGAMRSMVGRLRERRYDLAFVPHRSFRSGLLVWLTGIKRRVGYRRVTGSIFYTDRVPRDMTQHESARVLALLNPLDSEYVARQDSRPHLPVDRMDTLDEVDDWMDEVGLPRDRRLVVLAPGSVWATKRWPEEHWAGLLRLLREDRSLAVVLVGGPEDRDLCVRVKDAGGSEAYVAAGRLSVLGSAALISRAEVLVTGDTAPLHLAQGVRTPTVAIFGPTVPEFGFGPTGENDRILGTDLPCRPCAIHGSRECPLGHHHCMRWLREGMVHKTVRELLDAPDADDPSSR